MPQYEVQPGDNLWDIAEKTLGDPTRWREIYDDNSGTLGGDPGLIHPGQVLAIPYDDPVAPSQGQPSAPSAPSVPTQTGPAYPGGPTGGMPYNEYPSAGAPLPPSPAYQPQPGAPPPAAAAPAPASSAPPGYRGPSRPGPGVTPPSGMGGPSVGPQMQPPGARNSPSGVPTGGPDMAMRRPPSVRAGAPPQQGPQRYTLEDHYRDNPRPTYEQVGQPFRAQMGVTITPPIQKSINEWGAQGQARQQYGQPSAMSNPDYPVSPSTTVTWPAPPQQQGPDMAMRRPPSTRPAPSGQQTYIPTEGNVGMPQSASAPRTVVVINQDGSQMIYEASTGQWTTVAAPNSGPRLSR